MPVKMLALLMNYFVDPLISTVGIIDRTIFSTICVILGRLITSTVDTFYVELLFALVSELS